MRKKTCGRCRNLLSNRNTSGFCVGCRACCPTCGRKKDHRATECQSCGNRRQAKGQWQTGREALLAGLRRAGLERRTRFEDLSENSNWNIKNDGRRYIYYWTADNQHKTIYRYQWRWIKAYGPIPKGYVIHHKNEDRTCDDLGNLECMTRKAHNLIHLTDSRKKAMVEARMKASI